MDEKLKQQMREVAMQVLTEQSKSGQFSFTFTTSHNHDGLSSQKIDPKNLLGFPILTVEPTQDAIDGSILFSAVKVLGVTTYKLWGRLGGAWHYVTLT